MVLLELLAHSRALSLCRRQLRNLMEEAARLLVHPRLRLRIRLVLMQKLSSRPLRLLPALALLVKLQLGRLPMLRKVTDQWSMVRQLSDVLLAQALVQLLSQRPQLRQVLLPDLVFLLLVKHLQLLMGIWLSPPITMLLRRPLSVVKPAVEVFLPTETMMQRLLPHLSTVLCWTSARPWMMNLIYALDSWCGCCMSMTMDGYFANFLLLPTLPLVLMTVFTL